MNALKYILPILLLAALVGCRATKPTVTAEVQKTDSIQVEVRETVRYDTVKVPGGVVTVVQRVPCDSVGLVGRDTNQEGSKPIYKTDTTQRGHVRLIISNLGNGMQRIDCEADSLTAVIAAKDREISTYKAQASHRQELRTVTNTVVKYRVPWWVYALLAGWLIWNFRHNIIDWALHIRNPWQK
jgi:hypothetical protein